MLNLDVKVYDTTGLSRWFILILTRICFYVSWEDCEVVSDGIPIYKRLFVTIAVYCKLIGSDATLTSNILPHLRHLSTTFSYSLSCFTSTIFHDKMRERRINIPSGRYYNRHFYLLFTSLIVAFVHPVVVVSIEMNFPFVRVYPLLLLSVLRMLAIYFATFIVRTISTSFLI